MHSPHCLGRQSSTVRSSVYNRRPRSLSYSSAIYRRQNHVFWEDMTFRVSQFTMWRLLFIPKNVVIWVLLDSLEVFFFSRCAHLLQNGIRGALKYLVQPQAKIYTGLLAPWLRMTRSDYKIIPSNWSFGLNNIVQYLLLWASTWCFSLKRC